MDKNKFIKFVCEQLTKDLAVLKEAAKATAEAATHEESKPENEYDTRALEASYLAGAQSKRVVETEEALATFKHLANQTLPKSDVISAATLAEVELNGEKKFFFISPKGGGITLDFEGVRIQVITPMSPVGEAV